MSSAHLVPGADGLRILNAGESAVLAECADPGRILPLYARMRDAALPGIVDLVPAETTLLVAFDPARTNRARIVEGLQSVFAAGARVRHAADAADTPSTPPHTATTTGDDATTHNPNPHATTTGGAISRAATSSDTPTHVAIPRTAGSLDTPSRDAVIDIAVRYDGPDLDDVVRMLGLADGDELVALHTGRLWTAAFIGFAPGFAYLRGPDARLDLPRRATPRTAVPAGSVALAAGYCGIYPRVSPGGWHLIGTTDAIMWDATRQPAALVEPGSRVRFHRAG